MANSLAEATGSLELLAMNCIRQLSVELSPIPSILDNVMNFQVFNDDGHIHEFLTSSNVFTTQIIDGDEGTKEFEFDDDGVLNLKTNILPRGMIQLERIFNQDQINGAKRQKIKGDQYDLLIIERGTLIDSERVEAISRISLRASQKELRYFFGKINFVRNFITGFTEIVKPLNEMLKKNSKMEWTPLARKSFEEIKQAIVDAPVL
ncbi:uncharacterized protein LOC131057758 [Cryptomeria japonica]|uniref:uncharacterized protein LOC131057758 n=1 Tax=Cryptomeria japonica TaxID=3369 RepID=UPI0027DA2AD8|nr:uncharacterized protein LOC131057758 [Cryptomeria japonica]